MPDTLNLESDEFMTLLTDALRAGPASPEWRQAVKALRDTNQSMDEYTLLYTAREHLESGKDYRSVRAGPGFTRKVMAGVDDQSSGGTGVPTAGLIALLAAGAILVVVVIVGVMLLKGGGTSNPQQQAITELNATLFGNKVLTAAFNPPILPPEGWMTFGGLPLTVKVNELRSAAKAPTTNGSVATTSSMGGGYRAGGIVSTASLAAEQPIEIDVALRTAKLVEDGILQIFVSDEPIDEAHTSGSHALVWQLKGTEGRVFLADATAAPVAQRVPNWQKEYPIKLLLNRDAAVVQAGGKQLYAGGHKLSSDRPRYVGVRFLARPGERGDAVGVTSVTILKP